MDESQSNTGMDELESLHRTIALLEVGGNKKAEEERVKTEHLIEEARNAPTEKEAGLEKDNQSLQETLSKTQAERDAFKARCDELTGGIKAANQKLKSYISKSGIPVVAVLLIAGIGLAVYSQYPFGSSTHTQVAVQEAPPAGFQIGSAA